MAGIKTITQMKLLYKEKPRTIVIYSETHSLCFQQVSDRKNEAKEAAVAVELAPNENITPERGFKVLLKRDIYGCIGLIRIEGQIFLAVISGASTRVALPVDYESVDRIFSIDFISLSSNEWDFVNLDSNGMPVVTVDGGAEQDHDALRIHPCQDLKKLLSNGSFYYSNDFDLTSMLQERGVVKNAAEAPRSSKRDIDSYNIQDEYMWNTFMMTELLRFRSKLETTFKEVVDNNRFLTTVIRGFAKTVRVNSSGDTVTIISKQSWKRAGTRYNARGIDDNGNVANFVETEFIFKQPSHSLIFSFTQTRGSVPAFWEQDSTLINPKITLTRSTEATQPVFDKHFSELNEKYGVCHIVNLLSHTKPAETQLLRRYKELLRNSSHRSEIVFTEFDFHQETKQSGGFSGASKILPILNSSLENFGWFYYDSQHEETITRQNGIFRVNCLDCLDRTNLIQQVICQTILDHILNNERGENYDYHERFYQSEIVAKHNALWADNGDAISQIYTGTNALKSSFSRSGKMNFAGALSDVTKSVSRMYQNTFVDSKKQTTIDILLGYDIQSSSLVKIYDPINDHVQEQLKKEEHNFTTWSNINIFVGTFNVNAANPLQKVDLTPWLFPVENSDIPLPDIYAIGLQETIELNAGSLLNADGSKSQLWTKLIEKQLNSRGETYFLLRTESIASMALLLFVKATQAPNVTQVNGSSKKTGLGGITANKGGCAVRFHFGLTSFSLVTSHLAAGSNAVIERFNDFLTIMQSLTFVRNYKIKDHDYILWFGDLNYRISMQNEECRYLVENGAFDELLARDQLCQERENKGAFYKFREGKIRFYPTYKFDKGTSNYDSSEKQRVPSWTDRILYMSKYRDLRQLNYNSIMDIFVSDHKPVFSTFSAPVKFVDEEKKAALTKQIYEAYKLENVGKNEVPILDLSDSNSSSKPSPVNSESRFSIDTLSEMNLIDDAENTAPKLPYRHNVHPMPRRIPPPPLPRKTTQDKNFGMLLESEKNRKIELLTTNGQQKAMNGISHSVPSSPPQAPRPPPPRRVAETPAQSNPAPPIGFSSVPLVASSRSLGAGTPYLSAADTVQATSSTPELQTTDRKVSPLVPKKPEFLASLKLKTNVPTIGSNNTYPQNHLSDSVQSNDKAALDNKALMSEWKPLMPK